MFHIVHDAVVHATERQPGGGFGLRMREASDRVPKPMIPVGQEPILLQRLLPRIVGPENAVTVIARDGSSTKIERAPKIVIANRILDLIVERLGS